MQKIIYLCVLLFFVTTSFAQQASCPSWGPYVTANGLGGNGELIYAEVMADSSCIQNYTYWSSINFYIGPRGGYCGIQKQPDKKNNIFSVWDVQDTTVPQCYAEYKAPRENVSGFGGEGTGLHTDNPMPWTPNTWYATVVRRWYVGDSSTRVGFFMYDFGTKKWTHYATVVTPEKDAKLVGNNASGFLEKFSGETIERCGYYRNYFKLMSNGEWKKPTNYVAEAGTGAWKADSAFDNTAVKLYSCGNYNAPKDKYIFHLNQPDNKPSIAIPASVTSASAQLSSNNMLNVTWTIDESKSPQLAYSVNIFDNKKLNGTPLAHVEFIVPQDRHIKMQLPKALANGKYYAAVSVTDIFNQQSGTAVAGFEKSNAAGTSGIFGDSSYYVIINRSSNNSCITVPGASKNDGTGITLNQYRGKQNQQWKISSNGTEAFNIINRNSTKYIDDPGSSTNNNTQVIQYQPTGGENQLWRILNTGDGYYTISNVYSAKYLQATDTANNAAVVQYSFTNKKNQQWKIIAVNDSLQASASLSTKVEQLIIYPSVLSSSQSFTVKLNSDNLPAEIMIYDANGNIVYTSKQSFSQQNYLLSGIKLNKGIFIIKCIDKGGNILANRLIIF